MNFPILRLMKADFIDYYNQGSITGPSAFRKLCFVAYLDNSGATTLLWYALADRRTVMNPDDNGVPLKDAHDGFASPPILPPFKIGTFELTYPEIRRAIVRSDGSVNPNFRYLRFEAAKDSASEFIIYNIYYNNESKLLLVKIPGKKPSPPYGQD